MANSVAHDALIDSAISRWKGWKPTQQQPRLLVTDHEAAAFAPHVGGDPENSRHFAEVAAVASGSRGSTVVPAGFFGASPLTRRLQARVIAAGHTVRPVEGGVAVVRGVGKGTGTAQKFARALETVQYGRKKLPDHHPEHASRFSVIHPDFVTSTVRSLAQQLYGSTATEDHEAYLERVARASQYLVDPVTGRATYPVDGGDLYYDANRRVIRRRDPDYSAAPILADALQDAGCVDEPFLKELRSSTFNTNVLQHGDHYWAGPPSMGVAGVVRQLAHSPADEIASRFTASLPRQQAQLKQEAEQAAYVKAHQDVVGKDSTLPLGFITHRDGGGDSGMRGNPPPGEIWEKDAYSSGRRPGGGKWFHPAQKKQGRPLTVTELKAILQQRRAAKAAAKKPKEAPPTTEQPATPLPLETTPAQFARAVAAAVQYAASPTVVGGPKDFKPSPWEPKYPETARTPEQGIQEAPDDAEDDGSFESAPASSHVQGWKLQGGGFLKHFYFPSVGAGGSTHVVAVRFRAKGRRGVSEYEYYFNDGDEAQDYIGRFRAAAHPGQIVWQLIRAGVPYKRKFARDGDEVIRYTRHRDFHAAMHSATHAREYPAPAEQTPALVYADFLEENSQPTHAELIRRNVKEYEDSGLPGFGVHSLTPDEGDSRIVVNPNGYDGGWGGKKFADSYTVQLHINSGLSPLGHTIFATHAVDPHTAHRLAEGLLEEGAVLGDRPDEPTANWGYHLLQQHVEHLKKQKPEQFRRAVEVIRYGRKPEGVGHGALNEWLGKKQQRPIGSNKVVVRDGDNIHVRLHNTNVVTAHPDGSFTLRHGGWHTRTTADTIGEYTGHRPNIRGGLLHLNGQPMADGVRVNVPQPVISDHDSLVKAANDAHWNKESGKQTDTTPLQAYADYLQEHGHEATANLLRQALLPPEQNKEAGGGNEAHFEWSPVYSHLPSSKYTHTNDPYYLHLRHPVKGVVEIRLVPKVHGSDVDTDHPYHDRPVFGVGKWMTPNDAFTFSEGVPTEMGEEVRSILSEYGHRDTRKKPQEKPEQYARVRVGVGTVGKHISGEEMYTHDYTSEDGSKLGVIRTIPRNDGKTLHIDWVGPEDAAPGAVAHTIGREGAKDILEQLRSFYPSAEFISGIRAGGFREKPERVVRKFAREGVSPYHATINEEINKVADRLHEKHGVADIDSFKQQDHYATILHAAKYNDTIAADTATKLLYGNDGVGALERNHRPQGQLGVLFRIHSYHTARRIRDAETHYKPGRQQARMTTFTDFSGPDEVPVDVVDHRQPDVDPASTIQSDGSVKRNNGRRRYTPHEFSLLLEAEAAGKTAKDIAKEWGTSPQNVRQQLRRAKQLKAAAEQPQQYARPRTGDFIAALRRVRSPQQQSLIDTANLVSKRVGLLPISTKPAIHDEPTTASANIAHLAEHDDINRARLAAAWYGTLSQSRSLCLFHIGDGPDLLHRFSVTGSGEELRAKLDAHAIHQRTLLPHGEGWNVLIYDQGGHLTGKVRSFAQPNATDLKTVQGSGEIIGSSPYATADGKTRADYRSIITAAEGATSAS